MNENSPNPAELLEEARLELVSEGLSKYREVIKHLRVEKGFTFREISCWLIQRGIPCEHNKVYREYLRS